MIVHSEHISIPTTSKVAWHSITLADQALVDSTLNCTPMHYSDWTQGISINQLPTRCMGIALCHHLQPSYTSYLICWSCMRNRPVRQTASRSHHCRAFQQIPQSSAGIAAKRRSQHTQQDTCWSQQLLPFQIASSTWDLLIISIIHSTRLAYSHYTNRAMVTVSHPVHVAVHGWRAQTARLLTDSTLNHVKEPQYKQLIERKGDHTSPTLTPLI
jgi:hypothetical protein